MTKDEEKVRAAWEWYRERFSEPHEGYAQGVYIVQIPMHNFSASTAEEARSAAAAFTDAVIEEARQMRREIEIVERIVLWYGNEATRSMAMGLPCAAGGEARDEIAAKRAITRLQALYEQRINGLTSEALR